MEKRETLVLSSFIKLLSKTNKTAYMLAPGNSGESIEMSFRGLEELAEVTCHHLVVVYTERPVGTTIIHEINRS